MFDLFLNQKKRQQIVAVHIIEFLRSSLSRQ